MSASVEGCAVATVTVHPALDRTVSVPTLVPGAVHRAEFVSERAGGKGVNVAVALAAHGTPTAALGYLGRDNLAPFERLFSDYGIVDARDRLPGATRVGLKIIDAVRGDVTELNFSGPAPSPDDVTALLDKLDHIACRWCVLAGSLAPGMPTDFYARAIRRLRARGVRTALDTSGVPLTAALAAIPDLIKPNEHELAAWAGRALPDEAALLGVARAIVATGVGLVVVSRGASGALFVTRDVAIRARPPAIAVHSTVGAGDAMMAGAVAARIHGLPLDGLARQATAYALTALTRTDGSDPRALTSAYADRVVVESLGAGAT